MIGSGRKATARGKTIEQILDIEDNRAAIERLASALRETVVVPFVGAGLSIPFGYPGWAQFILKRAEQSGRLEKVQPLLNEGKFESATEVLLGTLGTNALNFAIEAEFAPTQMKQPDSAPVFTLPALFKGPVITTNFDRVIEQTFEKSGQPFQHVFLGTEAERAIQQILKERKQRFLIKIHGDVELKMGRILSKETYDQHYGPEGNIDDSRPLPQLISQILTNPILFIGCSLSQDRTLLVMKRHAPGALIPHFAIVPQPRDAEEKREKLRFMAERNIRPIWYPDGEHEYVDIILKHVVDKIGVKTRGKLLVPAIYALLIVVLGFTIFGWWKSPSYRYPDEIKLGIVRPSGVSDDVAEESFGKLRAEINALQEHLESPYQIAKEEPESNFQLYSSGGADWVRDLKSGTVDAVGVLSPYQISVARREADVEPIVSPRYGNSSTYEAVVFVSNKWLQKLLDEGTPERPLTDFEIREINRLLDEERERPIEYRIRPALWGRLLDALREREKRIGVSDQQSTSGYWYPRRLVLSGLDAGAAWDEVYSTVGEDELITSVRERLEGVVAGALAKFRLEVGEKKNPRLSNDLTVVHRIPGIPNGAFVVSHRLARDRELVMRLRETWGEASRRVYQNAEAADRLTRELRDPIKKLQDLVHDKGTYDLERKLKDRLEEAAEASTTVNQRLSTIEELRDVLAPQAADEVVEVGLQEVIRHDTDLKKFAELCALISGGTVCESEEGGTECAAEVRECVLERRSGFEAALQLAGLFTKWKERETLDTVLAREARSMVSNLAGAVEQIDGIADSFPSVLSPIKKCFPEHWNPVDLTNYQPAFEVFDVRDPREAPVAATVTSFLTVGSGLILLIVVGGLIQLHRRSLPRT